MSSDVQLTYLGKSSRGYWGPDVTQHHLHLPICYGHTHLHHLHRH